MGSNTRIGCGQNGSGVRGEGRPGYQYPGRLSARHPAGQTGNRALRENPYQSDYLDRDSGGAEDAEEARELRAFLRGFALQQIDQSNAERAVDLRRQYRMRLPYALIWATALQLGYILVTRNSRDFSPDHPGIRIP